MYGNNEQGCNRNIIVYNLWSGTKIMKARTLNDGEIEKKGIKSRPQ